MTRMAKSRTKPAKEPAKEPVKETPTIGSVEVEALARNIARFVEEGGKTLAPYLKPREEGKIKSETAEEVTDVVKTVGQVAEYWLSDPKRGLELQTSLGRAYLDLWASAVKPRLGWRALFQRCSSRGCRSWLAAPWRCVVGAAGEGADIRAAGAPDAGAHWSFAGSNRWKRKPSIIPSLPIRSST